MKTYNYILVSAMLLSVVACSNDDNMFSQYEADPYVVRIQPSISGIEDTRTSPAETNSTAFNDGDQICIGTVGEGINWGIEFTYKYDGDKWTPGLSSTNRYFRWDDKQTTGDKLKIEGFYAYYPASSSGYKDSFTIPTDQSTAENIAQADFMTYYGDITTDKDSNGTPSPAEFEMQRRTSRICVNIESFGDQYKDKNPTCDVTIYSQSEVIDVYYPENYTESDVTVAGRAYYPAEITPYNGKDLEKNGVAIALVSPQHKTQSNTEPTDMSNEVFVKVVVKYDTDKTDTLYLRGIPELKAGYSYTYNLKVGKDVVTVGSVMVKPWIDATIEGGVANE